MNTIIFEKRNLILITIALVVVMGVFFFLTQGDGLGEKKVAFASEKYLVEEIKYEINYGVEDSHYPSEVREESYKNIIQSEKYYNELKQLFFLSDSARYSNNFAGMFYDEYGILNVCLTQIDTNLVTQYKEVNFIQKEFSYNELNKVYDAFDESLFKMYDIQRVCIDEIDNEVEIYLLKDTHVENIYFALQEKINFEKKILKFIIDENSSFHFTANTVYGGESIYHQLTETTISIGTICVEAVNNATGDYGVLTNNHVAPYNEDNEMIYGGYFNGTNFSQQILLGHTYDGQQGNSVDAAFVLFDDQEIWNITAAGKNNTSIFNNIYLGNSSQLVTGIPTKKIGVTSGVTNGYVLQTSAMVMIEDVGFSDVILYSNTSLQGDSGGPVYYDNGTNLWLIGMNFGGGDFGGAGCKITNVMSALNITPITNDNINSLFYKVRLNKQSGSGGTNSVTVTYNQAMPAASAPTRTGYTFGGYWTGTEGTGIQYYNNQMQSVRSWDLRRSATLYAKWTPITYYVSESATSLSPGSGIANSQELPFVISYGESKEFTANDISGFEFKYWTLNGNIFSYNKTVIIFNLTTVQDDYFYLTRCYEKKSSCIAAGSLITLADGSQVAVENLTGNENLLVWNMLTGQYDSAPILFIDSDPLSSYEIIKLTFSDNTEVKVIDEHAFFDMTIGEYVFMRNDASQYIGHYFNKQGINGTYTTVQLINVTVYNETTTAWSPVTYGHLCYYVNGMLSMPGGTEGLINIFDVDTSLMQYDEEQMEEDILTYGLYTYEEFNAIIPLPEYVFDAFNGQYLKVSIGKGLITLDEIAALLERYAAFFE